jgi:hypothetical protein
MTSFDGYADEQYELPHQRRPASNDIESLLHLAIEIVNQAKTMPLSASILLSRDEMLDILERALAVLPEEVREARWALRDRDELMAAEMRKAEQLMDRVRVEAARMVDKTEIVRQARVSAEHIVSDAQERARTLINEAEDFCDQKLAGMAIVLDRLTRTVDTGRERLRPTMSVAPAPAPSALYPVDAGGEQFENDNVESDESSFFDQDAF